MKIKKLLALTLAVALLALLLAACGDSALKAAAGTYVGEYTKIVGDSDEDKDDSARFSLELSADGKGVHHRDDLDINVTWKLEGENFSMTETFMGMEMEYTGTLKDGRLDIFNGDPTNSWTCEYVYNKQ